RVRAVLGGASPPDQRFPYAPPHAGPSPAFIAAVDFSERLTAPAPEAVTLKYFFALPPLSSVASPTADDKKPLSSSLSRLLYTAQREAGPSATSTISLRILMP